MQVGSLVERYRDYSPLEIQNGISLGGKVPEKGVIYTIRGFFRSSLYLEEIVNPDFFGAELAYLPEYFRELQPPMTISID